MERSNRRLLGEILVEAGLITPAQLKDILELQQARGGRIGTLAIERGILSEDALVKALHRQLGVDVLNLKQARFHPKILAMVPRALALELRALPVGLKREQSGEALYVVMANPGDESGITRLQAVTGKRIRTMLAGDKAIAGALDQYYVNAPEPASGELEMEIDVDDSPIPAETDVELDITDPGIPVPAEAVTEPPRTPAPDVAPPPPAPPAVAAPAPPMPQPRSRPVVEDDPPPAHAHTSHPPVPGPSVTAPPPPPTPSVPPEKASAMISAALAAAEDERRLSVEHMLAEARTRYERAAQTAINAALAEAETAAQANLAAREAQLRAEAAAALEAERANHAAESRALRDAHAMQLTEAEERSDNLRRALREVEGNLAATTQKLADTQKELAEMRTALKEAQVRANDLAKEVDSAGDRATADLRDVQLALDALQKLVKRR